MDDADEHGQVHERVAPAGQADLVGAGGSGESAFGDQRGHVEVRPPHRARHREAEGGGDDDRPGDRELGHPDPDRHDRLAERHDDDESVPLAEVAGRAEPPVRATHQRSQVVTDQRGQPQQRLGRAGGAGGDQQQHRAGEHRRQEPHDLTAELRVLPAGQPEQRDVHGAHEEVATREDQRPVQTAGGIVESLRNGDREDEDTAHRDQQPHPDDALVGPDDVSQPGVSDPAPPHDRDDQGAADNMTHGRVVGHPAGHLGQGEHEHEVEEQLERRHRGPTADRLQPGPTWCRHGRIVPQGRLRTKPG
jgi:hypothetical protein